MNQQYYHTIKTRNNLAKIQRFNDIVIMRLSFPWYFSLIVVYPGNKTEPKHKIGVVDALFHILANAKP